MLHDLRIHLHMQSATGTIPRVLGVIERRGFCLVALMAPPHADGPTRTLSVCVDDRGRDPNGLLRQLDKLFDVAGAELVVRRPTRAV